MRKMKRPVAYLITFTTYGSWLHGDQKGSISRKDNSYGQPFMAPNARLRQTEKSILRNPPFVLNRSRRETVLAAILNVCRFRCWLAHAAHVRTNHVHIVVSGNEIPGKMMANFKAYATRAINRHQDGQKTISRYWTRHGSTKYLWTKQDLASAVKYVKNEQGNIMAYAESIKKQGFECKG